MAAPTGVAPLIETFVTRAPTYTQHGLTYVCWYDEILIVHTHWLYLYVGRRLSQQNPDPCRKATLVSNITICVM